MPLCFGSPKGTPLHQPSTGVGGERPQLPGCPLCVPGVHTLCTCVHSSELTNPSGQVRKASCPGWTPAHGLVGSCPWLWGPHLLLCPGGAKVPAEGHLCAKAQARPHALASFWAVGFGSFRATKHRLSGPALRSRSSSVALSLLSGARETHGSCLKPVATWMLLSGARKPTWAQHALSVLSSRGHSWPWRWGPDLYRPHKCPCCDPGQH